MSHAAAQRKVFPVLRYANCWEDGHVLCKAIRPAKGMRLLSIASAGDNSFALAAEGAEVVAVDLNPAQLACMELKGAAIRRLEHQEVLEFLGLRPHRGTISDTGYADDTTIFTTSWDHQKLLSFLFPDTVARSGFLISVTRCGFLISVKKTKHVVAGG